MPNPVSGSSPSPAPILDGEDASGPPELDPDAPMPPSWETQPDGFEAPILDGEIDPDDVLPPSIDLEPEIPMPSDPAPGTPGQPLNPSPVPILD
jgi:hypothetical protein